jgi:aldehyde:ferredoxin oxidoreductase
MGGYHGRYLLIDVGTGHAAWKPLPEHVLRRFLGGVGLGTWLLYHVGPARVDPLAPVAPLIFCFSSLVGTPLTTSAKFAVVAKSPLTFRLNDALSSSHFALAGKRTGADAIVLVGACATPSILIIEDGLARLEPAGALWGLTAPEATRQLTERFGPDYHGAVIGPAGERCVRYATISHGNRHAGRGGLGAAS